MQAACGQREPAEILPAKQIEKARRVANGFAGLRREVEMGNVIQNGYKRACVLLVLFLLLGTGGTQAAGQNVVCTDVRFFTGDGTAAEQPVRGSYYAEADLRATVGGTVRMILASYRKDTQEILCTAVAERAVEAGQNTVQSAVVEMEENAFLRLFVWDGQQRPLSADAVFPDESGAQILSGAVKVNGTAYTVDVNPLRNTISVDLPAEAAGDALKNAEVFLKADGMVEPAADGAPRDLTQPVMYTVTGGGKRRTYTLTAEPAATARSYGAEGAHILSQQEAEESWGGAYRAGAPSWSPTETGGGTWFIEELGRESACVTLPEADGQQYIQITKNAKDRNFTLWSGDNKETGEIVKLVTDVRFRVDGVDTDYGAFMSVASGGADQIVLTTEGRTDGGFYLACRPRGGETRVISHNALHCGDWHSLRLVFRRYDNYCVNGEGFYNGYAVEIYLDGVFLDETRGYSNLGNLLTGRLKMKDFGNSIFSQITVQMFSGCVGSVSLDDIRIAYVESENPAEKTGGLQKCLLKQKSFLEEYWLSSLQ